MNYAVSIGHQFHVDVLSRFERETNCSFGFINYSERGNFHGDYKVLDKFIKKVKLKCPSVILESILEGLFPENYFRFFNVPWVITESDILKYKNIESISTRLMDRSAIVPISSFSRRRFYLILLNYYSFILEHQNIQGLITFDTPHSFFSIVLYELCRQKGIKTIQLEYHFLTEYSIVKNSYDWPIIPKEYMVNNSKEEIKNSLSTNLSHVIFKNSKILEDYKSFETKRIVKNNIFSNLKLYVRFIDKALKNMAMGTFPFLFKKEILHFSSLNGIKNRFEYRWILNKQLIKLIRLNIYYNKLVNINLDLNHPYIFVGFHMQPEKTSQPMGGEFDNQLMMVKVLSESVPEGWKVYVKEHPNQFNVKKVPNRHYRDKLMYDLLHRMDNVELVPLEIDSIDLINNSQMVATLTGTMGWEAITRNIPAIVFGDTYYMSCRATRVVRDVDSCKRAILELQKLNRNEMEIEIYRYISFYFKNNFLVQCANWQAMFKFITIRYEEQIENLVEKFVYFHNKNLEH